MVTLVTTSGLLTAGKPPFNGTWGRQNTFETCYPFLSHALFSFHYTYTGIDDTEGTLGVLPESYQDQRLFHFVCSLIIVRLIWNSITFWWLRIVIIFHIVFWRRKRNNTLTISVGSNIWSLRKNITLILFLCDDMFECTQHAMHEMCFISWQESFWRNNIATGHNYVVTCM